MVSTSSLRAGITVGALMVAGAIAPIDVANASGPVERILQVATVPTSPSRLIVRYGAASEGLLFSEDGKSFRAMCTGAIGKGVGRISSGSSMYASPLTIDGSGRILVNTFDALWQGDGTGCNWTKVSDPLIDQKWITNLKVDPSDPKAVYALANISTGEDDNIEASVELLRRGADDKWSVVGQVRPKVARQRAYGGELLAAKTATGVRLYVSLTSSVGPLDAPQKTSVAASDDGGKTWSESAPLPAAQEYLTLLAADPTQPDRVLAVVTSDGPDTLLVSENKGKTFKTYGTLQETSGATFGPDGRVFIGDAGGAEEGGVYTAARLGQPLTKLPAPSVMETAGVDCLDFDARTSKLRACKLNRMGELDPQTGVFTELVQFETVSGLVECPGVEMKAVCQNQLNAGSSWCCTGHYPFTEFCGGYDITLTPTGKRVACGVSGRKAEIEAGRGPTVASDAGAAATTSGDAGTAMLPSIHYSQGSDDADGEHAGAPAAAASGGCALSDGQSEQTTLGGTLLGLFTLGLMYRRRARKVPPLA